MSDDGDGAGHCDGQRLQILLAPVVALQCLRRHVVVELVESVNESFGDARPDDVGVGLDAGPVKISDVFDVTASVNCLN